MLQSWRKKVRTLNTNPNTNITITHTKIDKYGFLETYFKCNRCGQRSSVVCISKSVLITVSCVGCGAKLKIKE